MTFTLVMMTLHAAVGLQLPPHGTRHPPVIASAMAVNTAAAADLAAAGHAVAEWCISADRQEATVAVSSAPSLAAAMRDFWLASRTFAEEPGPRGRQRIIAFPCWEAASDSAMFQRVLQHIQECSEVCEYLGESLMVAGRHPSAQTTTEEPTKPPYPMLLLRSFAQRSLSDYTEEYGGDDPFAALPDEAMDASERGTAGVASDAEVLSTTRAWVEAVIVKMKVCPFSSSADRAGIPAGGVTYPLSHASAGEEVYEQFWRQVLELEATDERELSTVLLITPRFALHSPGGFDAFADTLNAALTQLRLEEQVQLVFFHPGYTFRDGKPRLGGDDAAANFARRSPFPMINLLRTPQVRQAQKGVPTGSVYTTNERNLAVVGSEQLQAMLEERDWGGIYEHEYASHEENTWK